MFNPMFKELMAFKFSQKMSYYGLHIGYKLEKNQILKKGYPHKISEKVHDIYANLKYALFFF